MNNQKNIAVIIIILTIISFSCSDGKNGFDDDKDFIIADVDLLTNYSDNILYLDYEDAIHGFVVPSKNQTDNGFFNFNFTIKNNTDTVQTLYYKIYYRNESYKFPAADEKNPKIQHHYAHENFYGSWEDTNIGFKKAKELKPNESVIINDKFRIVGNPRNEKKYFYNGENDRWKRNPRVGNYSAIIVVTNEEGLNAIPENIKYLHKIDKENFKTPYFYFLHGDGSGVNNTSVFLKNDIVKVKAKPDLGKGIYVNRGEFRDIDNEEFRNSFTDNCGNCEYLYETATIAQFTHYIDKSAKMYNIPVIKDFFNDTYTKTDYNWGRAFYKKEERIGMVPVNARYPCQTVFSDPDEGKIVIRNPGVEYGEWRKQNVGMITRHGFTYGKYTVKANLTRLLNDDNVWNGITNAIWLIYQGGRGSYKTGWNLRRPCPTTGYMKTYWGGRDDDRVERVDYSEIDFEILKTVHYCPSNKFPPVYENFVADPNNIKAWNTKFPDDVLKYDSKIAVCCTNWDMACHEPKNFSSGCHEVSFEGKTFLAHRWEDVYRAVTTKYMAPDKELFGSDYYYFQIDWQPDKIIWRIGTERDQLYVVGYVDETISMIPDNQMLLIVTQEFHNTNWWPGSQYLQENIPFPKEDYVGEIYEIIIE